MILYEYICEKLVSLILQDELRHLSSKLLCASDAGLYNLLLYLTYIIIIKTRPISRIQDFSGLLILNKVQITIRRLMSITNIVKLKPHKSNIKIIQKGYILKEAV